MFRMHRYWLCFAVITMASPGLAQAQEDWPADPTGRFVRVDEGLRDTRTNLVWGFGEDEVSAFLRGNGMQMSFDFVLGLPILAPDGSLTTYPQFSNAFFGRSDTDWRLPTIAEMEAADAAGLTDYLDASPEDGFQPLGQGAGGFDPSVSAKCWSGSSAGTYKNFATGQKYTIGWWLDFHTGDSGKLPYYLVNYVPVRGAPPKKGK